MGKVIRIDVERWATAFDESGVKVDVSSRGNVSINGSVLSMEQVMRLAQTLAVAYGGDEEEQ